MVFAVNVQERWSLFLASFSNLFRLSPIVFTYFGVEFCDKIICFDFYSFEMIDFLCILILPPRDINDTIKIKGKSRFYDIVL